MAKMNFKGNMFKGNGSKNGLKAKVTRNTVAIVGEKGLVLVTNGSDISNVFQGDSVVDTGLEALADLLETVPDNTTEIVANPMRVVLPRVISGISTGSFVDWIRTGKTVSSGEVMPKERIELAGRIMKMMATKYANVELVADRHASDEDKKITAPAWEALKAEIASIVRGSSNVIGAANKTVEISDEDKARLADLKAKLAQTEDELLDTDDEAVEAKLNNKIGKLQSAIARLMTNTGAEEETQAPAVKPEVKALFQ